MKPLLIWTILLSCSLATASVGATVSEITITVDTSQKNSATRTACERELRSYLEHSAHWRPSQSWAEKTHSPQSLGAELPEGQRIFESQADNRLDMLALSLDDDFQIKVALLLVEKGDSETRLLRSTLEDLLAILKVHYDDAAIRMIEPIGPLLAERQEASYRARRPPSIRHVARFRR